MSNLIPQQDYAFYADEAGISQDRFTVVGGITARSERLERIHLSINQFRQKYGMHSELKWSKVSNQKLAEYKAFVDYFFSLNDNRLVHFHALAFDNHSADHSSYNGGDRDVGLSKLYYQLILHKFIRNCGTRGSLFVCLDHRTSSTPLETFKQILNHGAKKEYNISGNPIKQIISRDSKKDNILQLNDVILGAISAHRNGKHLLDGTRTSKKELAEYVFLKSGLQSLEANSPKHISRFTIWNLRARQRLK